MFRASFCWWGHHAVAAPADEQALVRACASLELLHASALVHDDLMDASDTRRGNPATHRAFESEHRATGWRGDAGQYGAAGAILLGDLLLSWSEELLRRCGLPFAAVAPALEVFDLCRSEVIAGQFLDVSAQARGSADVDTAMTVLRYKSAKYSIERPLQIGAALAGASEATLAELSAFGLPLGEAFQLRDDLLGRLRRPDAHRQARGRRPGRGQAHGPGRPGPGRRSPGRGRGARRRAGHRAARRTTSSGCAGSSTTPARTPRSRPSSSSSAGWPSTALDRADIDDERTRGPARPGERGHPPRRLSRRPGTSAIGARGLAG